MAVLFDAFDAIHPGQLGLLGVAGVLVYLIYIVYLWPNYLSDIRNIRGPSSKSIILGNLEDTMRSEEIDDQLEWSEKYGAVMNYRGFMGRTMLHISDPRALQHILLNRSYDYPKPLDLRRHLSRFLGQGILFSEGDDHKRQKKIMANSFSWVHVMEYLPIFQRKANQLRNIMDKIVVEPQQEGAVVKGEYVVIDVAGWLGKATLDIIGLAGFDYEFGQLDAQKGEEDNKLAIVFGNMIKPRIMTRFLIFMTIYIAKNPWLTKLPTKIAKLIEASMKLMQDEGKKMLDIRRRQAESGELAEKTDLLSIIVKANMLDENKKDKLRDDEIMGQIVTFTLAGHETSSLTVTWILLYLSRNPAMQAKLRAEVRKAKALAAEDGREELTADELLNMKYMDAVVRETMRCAPPVIHTEREADRDDVIPLSEPIIGVDGKSISAIPVKKGQHIIVGIYVFNYNKAIFGEDARQYRPDRWLEEDLESRVKGFSVWAPLLSFLGGPRGCIGYRFALLEVKTLLSTLIDAFEFLERDEGGTPTTRMANIVTRPVVLGEEELLGGQLPLRVRKAAKN